GKCTDKDVIKRRKNRRLSVISQRSPFDPVFSKPLSPSGALFIAPRMRPPGFKGQQMRCDPASAQFAQVRQDLRLHQRFPQSEITEIECPHRITKVFSWASRFQPQRTHRNAELKNYRPTTAPLCVLSGYSFSSFKRISA